MSLMTDHINREMLRHQVCHDIFCKGCNRVLDVRNAVSMDILKDGELKLSQVRCGACFDGLHKGLIVACKDNPGYSLEIYDGRRESS